MYYRLNKIYLPIIITIMKNYKAHYITHPFRRQVYKKIYDIYSIIESIICTLDFKHSGGGAIKRVNKTYPLYYNLVSIKKVHHRRGYGLGVYGRLIFDYKYIIKPFNKIQIIGKLIMINGNYYRVISRCNY